MDKEICLELEYLDTIGGGFTLYPGKLAEMQRNVTPGFDAKKGIFTSSVNGTDVLLVAWKGPGSYVTSYFSLLVGVDNLSLPSDISRKLFSSFLNDENRYSFLLTTMGCLLVKLGSPNIFQIKLTTTTLGKANGCDQVLPYIPERRK